MRSQLWTNVKSFLWPDSAPNLAIPSLDGGLTPNDDLNDFEAVAVVEDPHHLTVGANGDLLVAAGNRVVALDPASGFRVDEMARFEGSATALAAVGEQTVVCVSGKGLVSLDPNGRVQDLIGAAEHPSLANATSVAAIGDDLFVTVGSQTCAAENWPRDLMEKGASGELLRVTPEGRVETLLRGLAWPTGVAEFAGKVVFSESWRNRIVEYMGGDAPKELRGRIPGYPGMLHPAGNDELVVAVFAMRTYLVDFVLREDRFRKEMLSSVPMEDWIRPSYNTTNQVREPLQLGGIRALGETKPWAPPRSYGLVAFLGPRGEFLRSHHSRPGAKRHGIVAAVTSGSELFCLSAATGEVLRKVMKEPRVPA